MKQQQTAGIICSIYALVKELEQLYPGRHFTPDGHMVGSLGECLVAEDYELTLMEASNKGFDAMSSCGKEVGIKATQSKRVAFRSEAEHVLVIKINADGSYSETYNGPGDLVWSEFNGKRLPSNGQFSISLKRLTELSESLTDNQRLKKKSK